MIYLPYYLELVFIYIYLTETLGWSDSFGWCRSFSVVSENRSLYLVTNKRVIIKTPGLSVVGH